MTEKLRDALREVSKWLNEEPNRPIDREAVAVLCAAITSPDMEQRAGFVMVPVDPTEQMLTAASVTRARRDEANLYRHEVAAIYGAMLAAAPPIEALEGGKTDLGASGGLMPAKPPHIRP